MAVIVNFYGAPGSGKSTFAASLFARLKVGGEYKVELVTEYAKELAYEGKLEDKQWDIFLEQTRRLVLVRDAVDIIVTDSPLRLGEIYQGYSQHGIKTQKEESKLNNEFNIFIHRGKEYKKYGREQEEKESDILSKKIYNLMKYDMEIASTNDIAVHENLLEKIYSKFKKELIKKERG